MREIPELLARVGGSGIESLQATRRLEALAVETRDAAFAADLDACAPDLPA